MTGRRLRGRPPVFDGHLRHRYLTAVTAGMRLGEAAQHVGIHPNVPARHARTDPAFGHALEQARTLGKKLREENIPHGESRYVHQRCRCTTCTTDATNARTGRRHTPRDEPGGQVIDLPAAGSSSHSLLLARAS